MKTRKTTYDVKTQTVLDPSTGEYAEIETVKRQKIKVESDGFYMTFIDYTAPFFELKNGTAKSVLAMLCNMAQFNTGIVSLSATDRTNICKSLNISNTTLTNSLKELCNKKLLQGEKGKYQINAQIFWKGDLLSRKALLETKEFQITFSIAPESAGLKSMEGTEFTS